ncbi:transporter substrate-binding domain-containing protein [Pelagibacterium xiamenense]|uniref:transporter substrate-binding domain-containing protein n=1 Tax=Pelagibacterium xiamenense TaxID=2901140 RepID=UPI001E515647|nr:transporter substrate-binding domain-containing protein [Pelagibacterium xiamenense]MCD7061234.1 transporter substrate-binding domain-containing protein [Pelagibacterium xiamenense]
MSRFIIRAIFVRFAAACAAVLFMGAAVSAQDTLTVGVYESPPFVMAEGDGYAGMAIDLWEAIAGELGYTSQYQRFDTVGALVDATAEGQVDVAVTNMTVTEDRARRVDFTQPWYDAGLRLMVDTDHGGGFWGVINGLYNAGYLTAYAWLALVIVIATIGFTVFDRHFDKDFPRRWRDGVAESFYTVMSVVTSGRAPARKNLFGWIGRIWQALWLVTGIAVLAYVTSSVTSVMTTLQLTGRINEIADLPGHSVGVAAGSTAEEFVDNALVLARTFNGTADSVEALVSGRIDAVIGDAPVLEYYAHTHPDVAVDVVGPIFQPEKYAFAMPLSSALRRAVSVEVIGALEDGLIEDMREEYFGEAY